IWTLSSLSSTTSTVVLIAVAPSGQARGRNRRTTSRIVCGRQGFERYASHPASRARSSSPRMANAVKAMTRVSAGAGWTRGHAVAAVHAGRREVDEDHVGMLPPGELDGPASIRRLEGLVSLHGQNLDHDAPVVRVVLRDEYARRHGFRSAEVAEPEEDGGPR